MTSLPGVRLFCLYTFWGITFTYIYQITYFTAVLIYCGEMEDKGFHSLFGIKCIHPESASEFPLLYSLLVHKNFIDTKLKKWLCAGSICRDYDRKKEADLKADAGELPKKQSIPDEEKTGFLSKVKSLLKSLSTKEEDSDQVSH